MNHPLSMMACPLALDHLRDRSAVYRSIQLEQNRRFTARVLDLSPGGPEGLTDHPEGVLAIVGFVAAAVDYDVLVAGQRDSKLDIEHVAVATPVPADL